MKSILFGPDHYLRLLAIMNSASLNLQLGSATSALIYSSLAPEQKQERSNAEINLHVEAESLKLTIRAQDLSILRAALNSYIRWINCVYSIEKTIKETNNEL